MFETMDLCQYNRDQIVNSARYSVDDDLTMPSSNFIKDECIIKFVFTNNFNFAKDLSIIDDYSSIVSVYFENDFLNENKTDIYNYSDLLLTRAFYNEIKKESLIFSNYIFILKYDSSERALVYLYTSLINILNDVDRCETFINSINEDLLSVDAIVHIINALSPSKLKIKNWNSFISKAAEKLIEIEGEDNALNLLKVIV